MWAEEWRRERTFSHEALRLSNFPASPRRLPVETSARLAESESIEVASIV
jgi:hypothetical protein